MNALLPEFQTCLVRRYQAGFHPGYWSFVDKQINYFCLAGKKQGRNRLKPLPFALLITKEMSKFS